MAANPPCGLKACCQGATIPDRLNATIRNASGSNCTCIDSSGDIPIELAGIAPSGEPVFQGSGTIDVCGSPYTATFNIICTGGAAAFNMDFNLSCGGGALRHVQDSGTCDENGLSIAYRNIPVTSPCCNGVASPPPLFVDVFITD